MRSAILTFLLISWPCVTWAQFEDPRIQNSDIPGLNRVVISEENYGYVVADLWRTKDIPVCWENPEAASVSLLEFVQQAIDETWARYSALTFTNWQKCSNVNQPGIHIRIANEHPHVKTLGASLSGVQNGMVLNFTYDIDGFRTCNSSPEWFDLCNRAIAVHEFGHAIGFAHEHNRSDRDESCAKPSQGSDGDTVLTPYDPDSVMNYCNPKYGNYGNLSYYDVVSVRMMYGG